MLVVIMIMTIASSVYATGVTTNTENDFSGDMLLKTERESLAKYDSVFLANQENAYLNYEKLMEFYNTRKSTMSNYPYPDYYGGSYIDDFGNLIICVKEKTLKANNASRTISQILGNDDFITKSSEYSYNELNAVMDKLNAFKLENHDNAIANNFNIFWLPDRSLAQSTQHLLKSQILVILLLIP